MWEATMSESSEDVRGWSLSAKSVSRGKQLFADAEAEREFNLSGAAYNGYLFDAHSKWVFWLQRHGAELLALAERHFDAPERKQ